MAMKINYKMYIFLFFLLNLRTIDNMTEQVGKSQKYSHSISIKMAKIICKPKIISWRLAIWQ